MVCNRCIMVVRDELKALGFNPTSVILGEVELETELNQSDKEKIGMRLQVFGFELIDDRKSRLIGQIKTEIIHFVHHQKEPLKTNLSDHLSEKLHHDYSYLSSLFSETEGTTIEKYFIAQKIEKVKELLVYAELTLSEIAHRLHYSSVAHLSNQFKKMTGLTPSYFREVGARRRKGLDEV
ncbi:MAG: helix-turn-helix transcriptional regulator [Cytophagales bacterium]|nr:helix-turn-helix transcriptional regulator [Cytophagales bacterium]